MLDDGGFFFDDQDFLQALCKGLQAGDLHRKSQPQLDQAHTGACQVVVAQTQAAKHLHQVMVGFAGGDDADACLRVVDHGAIDAVDAGKGGHGVELVVQT